MATAVLHPDAQKFPAGTTVKAYKRSTQPVVWNRTGAPAGSQDASATVATDGSVTFTGLADSTEYLLYAAAPDRWASFVTAAAAAAAPTDRSPGITNLQTALKGAVFPRSQAVAIQTAPTSGTPVMSLGALVGGDVVSSISYVLGQNAQGTPTHQWAALLDANGLVLAVSADDLTNAWAADSVKSFGMGTPYVAPGAMAVYFALLIVATTPGSPIAIGANRTSAWDIAPKLSRIGPTGQTAPPAVGATLTPGAVFGSLYWAGWA